MFTCHRGKHHPQLPAEWKLDVGPRASVNVGVLYPQNVHFSLRHGVVTAKVVHITFQVVYITFQVVQIAFQLIHINFRVVQYQPSAEVHESVSAVGDASGNERVSVSMQKQT